MTSHPELATPTLGHYLATRQDMAEGTEVTFGDRISTALSQDGLERLSSGTRGAAIHELVNTVAGLTDVPILDLVAGGWRKYDALVEAARQSLRSGGVEIIDLATHEITSLREPSVDLILDGEVIATIHFEIRGVLVIKALSASVSNGRITALHSGDCDLTGGILANGLQLGSFQGRLHLPLELQLGGGILLLKAPPAS